MSCSLFSLRLQGDMQALSASMPGCVQLAKEAAESAMGQAAVDAGVAVGEDEEDDEYE